MITLEERLNNEIEWRFLELTNIKLELKNLLPNSNDTITNCNNPHIFRGMLLLVYSHLEGAIRDIFTLYVEYLNKNVHDENSFFIISFLMHKFKENKELRNCICYIRGISKMFYTNKIDFNDYLLHIKEILEDTRKVKLKDDNLQYINLLIELLDGDKTIKDLNLKIEKNIVNTESNLGYNEYIKMLSSFYIEKPDIISLDIRMKKLLDERNDIAHGRKIYDKVRVTHINDYIQNIDIIINLIHYTKDEILKKIV